MEVSRGSEISLIDEQTEYITQIDASMDQDNTSVVLAITLSKETKWKVIRLNFKTSRMF